MKFRTFALATAAVTLAASPAIAEASLDRASAPVEGASELGDDNDGGAIILAILAAAAIIAGIIILADNDGEELPTSP